MLFVIYRAMLHELMCFVFVCVFVRAWPDVCAFCL